MVLQVLHIQDLGQLRVPESKKRQQGCWRSEIPGTLLPRIFYMLGVTVCQGKREEKEQANSWHLAFQGGCYPPKSFPIRKVPDGRVASRNWHARSKMVGWPFELNLQDNKDDN